MTKSQKCQVVVAVDGSRYWYNDDGLLHRDHGPAVEYTDGDKVYLQKGFFVRDEIHSNSKHKFKLPGPHYAKDCAREVELWYIRRGLL